MAKPTFTVEINGKRHILTIGLGFLDKLDTLPKYQMEQNGIRIGASLQMLFVQLNMNNAGAIRDIIKYGTMTNADRLTESEIENWIYEQLEDDALSEKMYQDFLSLFEKLPGAKALIRQGQKKAD